MNQAVIHGEGPGKEYAPAPSGRIPELDGVRGTRQVEESWRKDDIQSSESEAVAAARTLPAARALTICRVPT